MTGQQMEQVEELCLAYLTCDVLKDELEKKLEKRNGEQRKR